MLELADIVRTVSPQERASWKLLPSQQRVLEAVEQCRTAALGGQVYQCDRCGKPQYSYHSCGNRHCPKCHGQQTAEWLEQQRARLLPCPYYLVTFTLPAELRGLARAHPKVVYGLLMGCAAAALQKLLVDPKWLGAQASLLAVLHTWTRAMLYHPHVHFLVSAGGLSKDGQQWLTPKNPKFLVPVRALSQIFRGKVCDALRQRHLSRSVPTQLWQQHKKWVVHAQPAGQGDKVLEYLGRYVFRIALANSRLERFENGEVTFRYRDNRSQEIKRVCLPTQEFLTRFLQHVLPKGFPKVRHYGLSSAISRQRHQQARALLEKEKQCASGSEPALPIAKPSQTASIEESLRPCPHCRVGRLVCLGKLLPLRKPP